MKPERTYPAAERDAQAAKLRAEGKTYDLIKLGAVMSNVNAIGPGYKANITTLSDNCLQPWTQPLYPYTGGFITTTYPSVTQLVEVKTVEVMKGHVGQVWYRSRIVWESKPQATSAEARKLADDHLAKALA